MTKTEGMGGGGGEKKDRVEHVEPTFLWYGALNQKSVFFVVDKRLNTHGGYVVKKLGVLRQKLEQEKSEVDSANASGTQALALRGLSNPGVLRLGLVYREAVSRYTFITPP